MQPSAEELRERYESFSDEELVELRSEGGLTGEATLALSQELERRGIDETGLEPVVSVEKEERKAELEGLDGWLLLVGLHLLAIVAIASFASYLRGENLLGFLNLQLGDAGLPGYSLQFKLGFLAGVLMEWLWLALVIRVVYLFLTKKQVFPKWFTALLLIGVCVRGFYWLSFLIAGGGSVFDEAPSAFHLGYLGPFLLSMVAALIWIPYVRLSRRVKATFVR